MTENTKFLSRKGVEVKVGDKVVVVAKWTVREGGMGNGRTWRNSWIGGNMDKTVGSVVEVKRIDENGAYFKGKGYWGGYGFPTMSVEHFEEVKSQITKYDTIEVGDTVKVIDESGSSWFYDRLGKEFVVESIDTCTPKGDEDTEFDVLFVEGSNGSGMWRKRFELVSKKGAEKAPAVAEVMKANGWDAEGKPMQFNRADLKPFMRVVTSASWQGIVFTSTRGKAYVNYKNSGFDMALFTIDEDSGASEDHPVIMEVYEQPCNADIMNHSKFGKLLWSRVDTKAAEKAAKIARLETEVEFATQQLKTATEALVAAKGN